MRAELSRLGIGLALGVAVGAWVDAVGWALACVLAAWLGWHATELRRFIAWSKRPLRRPTLVTELWRQPTDRIFRSLRAARGRSRDLAARLRRLFATTDALPDGAVMIRSNGEIEALNRAARHLLGLTASDRGKNLVGLVRHPDLVALIEGGVAEDIVEIPSPADLDRRLEVRRIRVDSTRYLVLARDVTQLNRLLTMRQDFVANVSHELRTPLTVIVGYLETMRESEIDLETVRKLLDRLNSPTQRMKALVDDLLLLTRLESSQLPKPSDLEPVDMRVLIHSVVNDAKQLSSGEHRFRVEVDPHLRLLGLEREIHSMVTNLVSNAVRYSPNGGDIVLRWFGSPEGPRFEVEDHGLGIAPQHVSRITERFFRVDLAGARVRGGTGLGLAIVKHVLKRHQSSLEVRSQLGKGSLFYCVFPPQLAVISRVQGAKA